MQYNNIMRAMQGNNGLSNEQKNENFKAFNELMDQGVYIPDLMAKIKEVDALKKRIEEMESAPKIDPGLFAMMESSVKDDPDVVKASKELSKRRDAIIDEVCRKDAEYSRLSDARRTAIETAYAKKNQKPIVKA